MFGAKVGPVKMSKSIAFIQFGKPIERTTSGIWIVVSAQLQAFNETTHVRAATITGTSGRMYRQSSRAQGALSEKSVQPGLPTKGVFVFELPESETSHMVLALSQQYAPQLADQLDILLEPDTSAPKAVLEIGKDGM